MFESSAALLALSTVFASIPVLIWLAIFFKNKQENKKILLLVFGLGCFTAPALLGLQYLWEEFPQFDLATFIETSIHSQTTMFIFLFILFGAMEEIIKMYVVKTVDKKTLLINNVNDAIKYSIASALGFSFTENIYYLYQFWSSISVGELAGMYIFRSVFTTCAHIIFSGIFGYYYGVGKFSITIAKQEKIAGNKNRFSKFIAKIFNLPVSEGFREKMIIQGLFVAIFMHSIFNYLLQFNIVAPVIIFVVIGYIFLKYLLNRKTSHLVLINDPTEKQTISMAKKDQDVVIELMGMWFQDKKYVDVLHICERLLERDPDNQVVQLFKAKAMDAMDDKDVYKNILTSLFKSKDQKTIQENNTISKYLTEKAMYQKVRDMVKKQMKKEGKTFIEPQENKEKAETKPKVKKDLLEDYTGDGTFKIK